MNPISRFKYHLDRLAKGKLQLHAIPSAAYDLLEQGVDTPSLRILAGLDGEDDIERYLNNTLAELSITMPVYERDRSFYIMLGLELADEILAGKKELYSGVSDLIEQLDEYDFRQETKHYVYDSIGFEYVYGLYYSFDDLPWAVVPGQYFSIRCKEADELKQKLKEALTEWVARMRTGS